MEKRKGVTKPEAGTALISESGWLFVVTTAEDTEVVVDGRSEEKQKRVTEQEKRVNSGVAFSCWPKLRQKKKTRGWKTDTEVDFLLGF